MYSGHCNREDYSGYLLLLKKKKISPELCGVRRHVIISHNSDWAQLASHRGAQRAAEDIRGGCGQLKIHLH